MEASDTQQIAARYVKALLMLVNEQKAVDAVEKDFIRLLPSLEAFGQLFNSPIYSREAKANVMESFLTRLEVHPLTTQTIRVIAANDRLSCLLAIIRQYFKAVTELRKEVEVKVTSAIPLSDAQEKAVNKALADALNKTVKTTMDVDADLLGGIVIEVGTKMLDLSLQNKLKQLTSHCEMAQLS